MITVTRPSLPPLGEFIASLEKIWTNHRLTNQGPFERSFEEAVAEYLGVEHVSLFCNGMIALQIGLQALRVTGEVITTPFSFPATTHAIYWNHCTPVFCDIDPVTYNIDVHKIEALITPKTTAILPVHVYGNPCDTSALSEICERYGLKLFYDAAHAFGVRWQGLSLMDYGDLAMVSFHATKVFNTIEGGALVTRDPKMKKRIDYLKNFGIADEETVVGPGSNGKMNELQAAFGLLQLKYIDGTIAARDQRAELYRHHLSGTPGVTLLATGNGLKRNWAYFPVLFDPDKFGVSRDTVFETLKKHDVLCRKYFYPLISQYPTYRGLSSADPARLSVAQRVASEVLCLPMYSDLALSDVDRICELVLSCRRNG